MEILLIRGEERAWERIALPARPVAPVRIMCDILGKSVWEEGGRSMGYGVRIEEKCDLGCMGYAADISIDVTLCYGLGVDVELRRQDMALASLVNITLL